MDLMDELLKTSRSEVVGGQVWAQVHSFREFKACGAPEIFGDKDPIAIHPWIDDMENAHQMCFCPEGENVGLAYFLLKERE